MASLYAWLSFIHVLAVGTFLFAHGVSGTASLVLRGPISGSTRALLSLSQRSAQASSPAILVIVITGIWMTFAGHWSSRLWPWAALVLLVAVTGVMFWIARPYYMAREAMGGPDEALEARLAQTRPRLALWIGAPALVLLFGLMIFKPF